ncbi:MAG: hypothetical protein U1F43_32410 [Myxococcota bacterium]
MAVDDAFETLDPKEVAFVQRTLRLFVALSDSRVARRAVRLASYSKEQHALGIALRRQASGDDIPLPADLADLVPTTARPYEAAIGRLDDFENTWVPLTRTAAAMTLSPAEAAIVAELFKRYEQAPRGPDVVRTVKAWLAGWDALGARAAELPGADAMKAQLVATGLKPSIIDAARADVAAIEAGGDMSAPDPDAAREAAKAAQRDGFTKLKAWVTHWGTRFRQTMPYQDLVKMGLRKVSNKKAADAEDDEVVPEDDATTGAAPTPVA